MNIQMLRKNVNQRVRLHPPALRVMDGRLQPVDDVWVIQAVTPQGQVTLSSDAGYLIPLEGDHIRNYTSDPIRSQGGLKHGILSLTISIELVGLNATIRPL